MGDKKKVAEITSKIEGIETYFAKVERLNAIMEEARTLAGELASQDIMVEFNLTVSD